MTIGEAFTKLVEYNERVLTKTGKSVRSFRLDGGKEYGVKRLQEFGKSKAIEFIIAAPSTPSENGLAEVSNRLINNLARTMVSDGKLPADLWPEAVKTAVYLLNRSTTSAHGHQITPIQKFDQLLGKEDPEPRDLSNLRGYGCDTYVHEPDQRRVKGDKFGPRGVLGKLVGYEGKTTYRIWVPARDIVVRSISVQFNEESVKEIANTSEEPTMTLGFPIRACPHQETRAVQAEEEIPPSRTGNRYNPIVTCGGRGGGYSTSTSYVGAR